MDEVDAVVVAEDINEAVIPEEKQESIILATIAEIGATGVKIVVDGDEEAGDKEYRVNCMQKFSVGDRVKICKNSGTYLVEYKIGSPMSAYPIPSGGSDGQVLTKDGVSDYSVKWSSGGSASEISNGNHKVTMSSVGVLTPSSSPYYIDLGSSTAKYRNLYLSGVADVDGNVFLCGSSTNYLGFFGSSGARRQTVANTATVATLITALKAYGLIA